MKVRTLFDDAVLLVLIAIGFPLAVLVLGAPLAMIVRLLIAVVQRLL